MTFRADRAIRLCLAAATLLAVGAGGSARAEANGVKFGEGRLHPFFQLESRYDSAAVLTQQNIVGDLVLHFRPGLKLDMPSPTFAVGLTGNLEYALYTGAINPGAREASHLGGEAALDLGFNRGGQVSLDVGDQISRSERLVDAPTILVGALSLYNDARLQLNYRPVGGALQIEPNYHLTTEFFTPSGEVTLTSTDQGATVNPQAVSDSNYLTHTVGLNGRWKFLPKTAVTLDSSYLIRSYFAGDRIPTHGLKASLGLAGLLSTHFSTILKLGWGQDFGSSSYSSPIAQAEIGYLFSQTGQLRLGYLRTFYPVPHQTYSTYGLDRAYLDGRFLFLGRLTARGTASLDFLGYRAPGGEAGNSDFHFNAELGADYELTQWASISAGYAFRLWENVMALSNFNRNEVYLRAQLIY